jgi:hypothetical protein
VGRAGLFRRQSGHQRGVSDGTEVVKGGRVGHTAALLVGDQCGSTVGDGDWRWGGCEQAVRGNGAEDGHAKDSGGVVVVLHSVMVEGNCRVALGLWVLKKTFIHSWFVDSSC